MKRFRGCLVGYFMQKLKMRCRKLVRHWYSKQKKYWIGCLHFTFQLTSLPQRLNFATRVFSEMEECHRKIAFVLQHNTFTLPILNSPKNGWTFSYRMLKNTRFLNILLSLLYPSISTILSSSLIVYTCCWVWGFCLFVALFAYLFICFKVNEHQRHLE